MLKKILFVRLLLLTMASTPWSLSAQTENALLRNNLLNEVEQFLTKKLNPEKSNLIKVAVLPLDTRIKVRACSQPLIIELANRRNFSRQFSVKVSCASTDNPWKKYVQAEIKEYVEALVTKTHIAKGMVITDDMISITLVDKFRIKVRSTDRPQTIVGGRALRNIQPGYQISSSDVCLVCKGDDVAIIAKYAGMHIKTSGTAIENGSFGESIKVKNNSSSRIVKGVIGELRQIYVNL